MFFFLSFWILKMNWIPLFILFIIKCKNIFLISLLQHKTLHLNKWIFILYPYFYIPYLDFFKFTKNYLQNLYFLFYIKRDLRNTSFLLICMPDDRLCTCESQFTVLKLSISYKKERNIKYIFKIKELFKFYFFNICWY